MSQTEIVARLQGYNRDLIRKAAKAAGVVNVTYKSKSENIDAMIALGVVDITEAGEPVRTIQVVHDAAEAARQERIERIEALTDEGAADAEIEAEVNAEEDLPIGERSTESLEAELDRLLNGNVRVGTADRIEIIQDELASRDMEDEYDPEDEVIAYPDREGDVLDDLVDASLDLIERADEIANDPMAGVSYSLAMDALGNSVLTLVVDGEMSTVSEKDALYTRLVTALLAKEDVRPFLGDVEETVARWVGSSLSDRVRIEYVDGEGEPGEHRQARLYIDGEEVHGKVVDQFKRYWLEGRDPANLLRFLERVASNPLSVAEHNLYGWKSALTIDADGYFIGFKGMYPADVVDGVQRYKPSHRGPGEVNGVTPEDGWLKVKIGDVVTMDRSLVLPGPECGVGLHVGTYDFAKGFAKQGNNGHRDGVVMEVQVDPADIVNVPNYETGKLRCCRYKVLAFHTSEGRISHLEPEATWTEEAAVAQVEDVFEDQPAEALGFFRRIFRRRQG